MSDEEYLWFVKLLLADKELSDGEQRLVNYYFHNSIPARTAARQIHLVRNEP